MIYQGLTKELCPSVVFFYCLEFERINFQKYLALRLCESVVSPAAPAVDLLLRLNFVQTSSADFESVKIEQFLPAKKFTSGKIFCH